MRKHQRHKVGLLGRLQNYLNELYVECIDMRNFDEERTQKVIGFFCEILMENNCNILEIRAKEVDWEFTSGNKHFRKLMGRDINSYSELNHKELKEVKKLESKWNKRWQKKALKRYMMDVDGSKTAEKMELIKDIKAELKDSDGNEDLKKLLDEVS